MSFLLGCFLGFPAARDYRHLCDRLLPPTTGPWGVALAASGQARPLSDHSRPPAAAEAWLPCSSGLFCCFDGFCFGGGWSVDTEHGAEERGDSAFSSHSLGPGAASAQACSVFFSVAFLSSPLPPPPGQLFSSRPAPLYPASQPACAQHASFPSRDFPISCRPVPIFWPAGSPLFSSFFSSLLLFHLHTTSSLTFPTQTTPFQVFTFSSG